MRPDTGLRRALPEVYRYSGLGCIFAAAVLLFMAGGWLLDDWLGTMPLLTVIGALAGAVLATVRVWRVVLPASKDDKPDSESRDG